MQLLENAQTHSRALKNCMGRVNTNIVTKTTQQRSLIVCLKSSCTKLVHPHCIYKVLLASGLAINSLYKLLIPCSHSSHEHLRQRTHPEGRSQMLTATNSVYEYKSTCLLARAHARARTPACTHLHMLVTHNVCSVSEQGVDGLASTRKGTTNADSRTFETYYIT